MCCNLVLTSLILITCGVSSEQYPKVFAETNTIPDSKDNLNESFLQDDDEDNYTNYYSENETLEWEEKNKPKQTTFNRIGDMLVPIAEFYSGIFVRKWTRSKTGLVFVFSKSFRKKEVSVLELAVNDLANSSCVPIRLLNETQYRNEGKSILNYVYISRYVRKGCYSNVGMMGGKQRLNLDPYGCINKGNALHEMMHTLGYEHEQSRPDRDQYVSINYKNVLRGYEPNFWISWRSTIVGPYDFQSIMQYRADAFAKNPRIPTITSKVKGKSIPLKNGSHLTELDILKIKTITGCEDENSNKTTIDEENSNKTTMDEDNSNKTTIDEENSNKTTIDEENSNKTTMDEDNSNKTTIDEENSNKTTMDEDNSNKTTIDDLA